MSIEINSGSPTPLPYPSPPPPATPTALGQGFRLVGISRRSRWMFHGLALGLFRYETVPLIYVLLRAGASVAEYSPAVFVRRAVVCPPRGGEAVGGGGRLLGTEPKRRQTSTKKR